MKNIIKGIVVVAVITIVSLVIHVFCNMHGVDLNSTATGTVSALCALLLYQGLTRNEKNKEL